MTSNKNATEQSEVSNDEIKQAECEGEQNSSTKFNMSKFITRFNEKYTPEFFSSSDGDHFIRINSEGQFFTYKIGKKSCIDFLITTIWEFEMGGGRSKDIAGRIMDEFSGKVLLSKSIKKVSIRVGKDGEDVLIDMCNERGEFIKINKNGFSITRNAQISFLKYAKHLALPTPQKINLKEFMLIWNKFFNFTDEGSAYLALAYVVKSLIPQSGANPILIIEGIQGSGKTTTSTILKKLIDPTEPALMSPPKNEKEIFVMANSCYLIACDNLSYLTAEMSDVFCRVSTGGGISQRKLYTDDDEKVYDVMRPVLFNGIEQLTERPDLLERAIVLQMKTLKPENRISEGAYWIEFESVYPKLLGGLYSIISMVLDYLPQVRENNLHRMTEFNRVGLAIDKALEMPVDHFSNILEVHQEEKLQNLFHNDIFLQTIAEKLNDSNEKYLVGTCNELIKLIFRPSKFEKYPAHVIPKNPRQFRARLDRSKFVLEANGIEFGVFRKTAKRRELFIKITNVIIPESYGLPFDFDLENDESGQG